MITSKPQQGLPFLVTFPNQDTNAAHHTHIALFPSVGHMRYLSRGAWLCVATPPAIPLLFSL